MELHKVQGPYMNVIDCWYLRAITIVFKMTDPQPLTEQVLLNSHFFLWALQFCIMKLHES